MNLKKLLVYLILTVCSIVFYDISFYDIYGYSNISMWKLLLINMIIISPLLNYLTKKIII
jgi:hypothetical protein